MNRGDSTTDDQMLEVIEAPPARWGWDRVLKRTLQIAKNTHRPEYAWLHKRKLKIYRVSMVRNFVLNEGTNL